MNRKHAEVSPCVAPSSHTPRVRNCTCSSEKGRRFLRPPVTGFAIGTRTSHRNSSACDARPMSTTACTKLRRGGPSKFDRRATCASAFSPRVRHRVSAPGRSRGRQQQRLKCWPPCGPAAPHHDTGMGETRRSLADTEQRTSLSRVDHASSSTPGKRAARASKVRKRLRPRCAARAESRQSAKSAPGCWAQT